MSSSSIMVLSPTQMAKRNKGNYDTLVQIEMRDGVKGFSAKERIEAEAYVRGQESIPDSEPLQPIENLSKGPNGTVEDWKSYYFLGSYDTSQGEHCEMKAESPTKLLFRRAPVCLQEAPTNFSHQHVVRPGETYESIATDHGLNRDQWLEIYCSNKENVPGNPNLLYKGATIMTPPPVGAE